MAEEYVFNKELEKLIGENSKYFKRKVMGICGKETNKSINELSKILVGLKIVNSLGEGTNVLQGLDGQYLRYGSNLKLINNNQEYRYLFFQKMDEGKYKITNGLFIYDEFDEK